MPKRKVNLAILDMYDGEPNQGMRCIHDLLSKFSDQINFREFDVRGKNELPDVADFDVFISTGGPGNPLEGDGNWIYATLISWTRYGFGIKIIVKKNTCS